MSAESRYSDADQLFVAGHSYDEIGELELYEETGEPAVDTRSALYRLTTLPLPDPPEQTYMVRVTDNFPLLAKQLYNDSEKWWVLAEANPHIRHPLDLKAADIIYLPS